MKKEVRAIIFDFSGVLALARYSNLKRGHRLLGVHESIQRKLNIDIDTWFDAIDSTYSDAIEGKVSRNKTLKTISKNLNIKEKKLEKIIIKSYKKGFKQNKELYKIAFNLKHKGYKIAILSDQWYFSSDALILKKYTKKFNKTIVSCYVGMRKPNPKIYKFILRKLKLKPEDCLFIDNREWNLKPARQIGMKTILFKNNRRLTKDLKKQGVKI